MKTLLAMVVAVMAAAAQAPSPTGTGSIEGAVLNAITKEPLRKAQVTLYGQGPQQRAVTDSTGRFVFRGLPAAMFWLNATRHDFMPPPDQRPVQVSLGAGEEKKGLEILLMPPASLEGKVVDDDGVPVPNCPVSVMTLEMQDSPVLANRGGASTNDEGEYQIRPLAKGRYYVYARCQAELPVPHAFMATDDPRRPFETYAPQFYPGTPDPEGAARLVVAPGTELRGINFQVHRIRSMSLRGTVTAASPEVLGPNLTIMLAPRNPLLRMALNAGAGVNPESRTFEFRSVMPGSYWLIALSMGDHPAYGQVPVEIGNTAPDPVEIVVAAGMDLPGTVQADDSDTPLPENFQISLHQAGGQYIGPQPQGKTNKDGTFVLNGVVPGRWRLEAGGLPGYVKSLSLADQDVSPYGFDVPAGARGPLRIVLGTKMGSVEATLSGAMSQDRGQVGLILIPEDPERRRSGLERIGTPDASGHVRLDGVVPGKYLAFALESAEPWRLINEPALLKSIENRNAPVEVTAGEKALVSPDLITAAELQKLAEEAE